MLTGYREDFPLVGYTVPLTGPMYVRGANHFASTRQTRTQRLRDYHRNLTFGHSYAARANIATVTAVSIASQVTTRAIRGTSRFVSETFKVATTGGRVI